MEPVLTAKSASAALMVKRKLHGDFANFMLLRKVGVFMHIVHSVGGQRVAVAEGPSLSLRDAWKQEEL